jgi:YfiH family protein
MIRAANFLDLEWLEHGFGERGSVLPVGIRTVKQIHSRIVLDAAVAKPADTGDALISDRAGVAVGVKTADCVPVLLVDSVHRVVAAVHAGWRGSAENIAGATVAELAARWNTRAEDLRAAVGPSIGGCCYEVGADVARRFEKWCPEMRHAEGPVRLDLRAVNEAQLRAAGITNIWTSAECTFCVPGRFYSFRREREQAGRMISFVGIRNT